jgi:hypothetical protein
MTNIDNTAAITSDVQPLLLDVAPAPSRDGRLDAAFSGRVTDIVTKTNRVVGKRFTFSVESLAQFKAGLTAKKIRGDARRLAMQEFFHADAVTRARMLGRLWLEGAYEKGMAPDTADLREKSGTLRLVSTLVPEKPAKKGGKVDKDAEIARLKAELAALKAAAAAPMELVEDDYGCLAARPAAPAGE